ncbi:MAG TPA: hypothetical protein VNK43_08220, partial [Gemmatimonadales bacterium]|nr:hypothetical protein [Gemmatimonadales bacterium]
GRNLELPHIPPISVRGVLRSEVEGHLERELGRYLRAPEVRATTTIRLAVLGSIGKPGFYQLPADLILSEAIMQAGGPPGEISKSVIRRNGEDIVDTEQFQEALTAGMTLDQLNLRAGDEIFLEAKQKRDMFTTLRTVAIIPALIVSTYGVGKLVGIF